MDWHDMTPDEARKKMIAAMRLDAEEAEEGEEERPQEEAKGGHGNTRLPYGLCKRFGIDLSDDATPREAWAALEKGTGYSHNEVMDIVKKAGNTKEMREKKSGGGKATPRCEGSTLKEVTKYYNDTLGLKTAFKTTANPEVAKTLANCIADAYDYAPKVKGSMVQCGTYSKINGEVSAKDYIIWKNAIDKAFPDNPEYLRDYQAKRYSRVVSSKKDQAIFFGGPNEWKKFDEEDLAATEELAKQYRGIYLGVGIESSSMEDIEKDQKKYEASGWNPKGCNTAKSLFDHEVGHALDHAYKLSDNDDVRKCIQKYGNEKISSGLSRYAGSRTSEQQFIEETIAEAWTEYRNNPEPRPIAKELGGIIERIIKEDGGKQ